MKFLNWIKKHLMGTIIIGAYVVALIVIGSVMLSSYVQYTNEQNKVYQNQFAVKLKDGKPTKVFVDDEFAVYTEDGNVQYTRSKYKNAKVYLHEDLMVETITDPANVIDGETALTTYISGMKDGTVTAKYDMLSDGYADIELVLAHNGDASKKGLLGATQIKIDDTNVKGTIDLDVVKPGLNWHHVILTSVPLAAGEHVITLESTSYMPEIRNFTVYSNGKTSVPKDASLKKNIVDAKAVSLEVVDEPVTDYGVGDVFDDSLLTLKANFEKGVSVILNRENYTFEAKKLATSDTVVTIKAFGLTLDIDITVA